MKSESDCLNKWFLCFLDMGECVTVEVFMLCDLTMFSIFSFLISFIVLLDVQTFVSTIIW